MVLVNADYWNLASPLLDESDSLINYFSINFNFILRFHPSVAGRLRSECFHNSRREKRQSSMRHFYRHVGYAHRGCCLSR